MPGEVLYNDALFVISELRCMKLKELPGSLLRSWQLHRVPLAELKEGSPNRASECVVSLTSIPSRLGILQYTLRSLLTQTLAPDMVVLWLHESLQTQLPEKLSELQSPRCVIRYSNQTCAHRKLVESLPVFPDKVIVTCDDDVMYPEDWLSRLWSDHLLSPKDIIAHECRHIRYDPERNVLPYGEWRGEPAGAATPQTLAIGYSGVLYPPGALHPDVTDRSIYDELAPRADDLWFKAMSLRAGTLTRRCRRPADKPTPVAFSQSVSLKKSNVRADGNQRQWNALDERFSLAELLC